MPRLDGTVRGLFMGSGSSLAEPGMAERVIDLTGRDAAGFELLYLGTATYDAAAARVRQTAGFARLGCTIRALDVATRDASRAEIEAAVERASAVLVSGGNTLYAVDRWIALGLDGLLRAAVAGGLVACGGSAGAICWFDGGHSDSMDPTSYLDPLPADDPRSREWRYIRVDGLGLLPGLLCPHFEMTQSNGVPRASDFEAMLLRHAGESGIGLDNWAGLLVEGDRYEVVRSEGREGSVRAGRFVDDGSGVPGLWALDVIGGRVTSRPAPATGRLDEIMRPARARIADPLVEVCRAENPSRLRAGAALSSSSMAATPKSQKVRYRQASPPGAGRYEVVSGDVVIGTVGRFALGAGQFGTRWVATTPDGRTSNRHATRDSAASWLIEQAGPTSRS
jgi:dipeptidase E